MRDGIAATTSALVSDPARRDSPPLSEFFGGQNFKEGSVGCYELCSGLCSSGFHIFPVNNLQCMAVLKTAVLGHADEPSSFLASGMPQTRGRC
jgi:hypothetical protein